jgi:predicted RNA-binding Zn-ribbon protein involved in translation (DUF1610 family)
MSLEALKCPSCGGPVAITQGSTTTKCPYCDQQGIVVQAVSSTLAQPTAGPTLENFKEMARVAMSGNNYQQAYDYYLKILEIDTKSAYGWLGRAKATGKLQTNNWSRLSEIHECCKKLYEMDAMPNEIRQESAESIAEIVFEILSGINTTSGMLMEQLKQPDIKSQPVFNYGIAEKLDEIIRIGWNLHPNETLKEAARRLAKVVKKQWHFTKEQKRLIENHALKLMGQSESSEKVIVAIKGIAASIAASGSLLSGNQDASQVKEMGRVIAKDMSLLVKSKNRFIAASLAICLGAFGTHHFYLGNYQKGIKDLLLCWTMIPFFKGVVDGVKYLSMDDEHFALYITE